MKSRFFFLVKDFDKFYRFCRDAENSYIANAKDVPKKVSMAIRFWLKNLGHEGDILYNDIELFKKNPKSEPCILSLLNELRLKINACLEAKEVDKESEKWLIDKLVELFLWYTIRCECKIYSDDIYSEEDMPLVHEFVALNKKNPLTTSRFKRKYLIYAAASLVVLLGAYWGGKTYYASILYNKGIALQKERKAIEALDVFKQASDMGNTKATYEVGNYYYKMSDFNNPKVTEWLIKAAELGHMEAQALLADCYAKRKTHKDDLEALKWYIKAAEQGHAVSQTRAGVYYLNNIDGGYSNYEKAVKWLTKAVEQKEPEAFYHLGTLYLYGKGVKQDQEKGFNYLKKSAVLEYDSKTNLLLGKCYLNGTGCKVNKERAIDLISSAALFNAEAAYVYGMCYETGDGVPQNYVYAFQQYKKAKELGYPNIDSDMNRVVNAYYAARKGEK